ncbi:hypothetical protein [Neptuniibacter caesariensis]|uniref:EfeO-type cupredoxin-like domain-containing protein n=1 Tax=Neptuniibacter caesariensis TaxID=207954 RepID=A0A7U8GTR9_NEPCE|nr:hypothetical protein [Neptuniibacter caesariensis]EAR62425.1 hypothetical protein MED92_15348 [Oceanospirillum sp. MED92] [Neptuniibacter caesariensis]
MKFIKQMTSVFILISAFITAPFASAATPETRADGVTVIHLDEYSGYFSAKETLAGLKAGEYEFVVTNKSDKLVGFQIQNFKTHEGLDMFPLEPGEQRISRVTVTTDGVRFRCPINPTPWYDIDGIN